MSNTDIIQYTTETRLEDAAEIVLDSQTFAFFGGDFEAQYKAQTTVVDRHTSFSFHNAGK